MSNSDKSASISTRFLRNRTLAYYYDNNPNKREAATNTTFDQSARLARAAGQQAFTIQHALKPNAVSEACCGDGDALPSTTCTTPGGIVNFQITSSGYAPNPPYGVNDWEYNLSWDPVPGATSYAITLDVGQTVLSLTYPTATTANVIFTTNYNVTITLTASNSCGTSTGDINDNPCFLEGALVTMADLSTKPIEFVCVGDLVLGAFGEINTILALHRPLIGTAPMCRINGEHSTTNHHPHISADKKFYCGDPARVLAGTYGREHDVLLADGVPGRMYLHGLAKERIHTLACGVELKTVEGSRIVHDLEVYALPPETQLYNLVVGGSHTYHVEGYAVTGWPREDDFDYDVWAPRI
jgi:hypothetical protein